MKQYEAVIKTKSETEMKEMSQGATDIELAVFFSKHIDNPCEVEVEPGRVENIRGFYLREAKGVLDKMTNPEAKKLLELKIQEYQKDDQKDK